MVSIADDRGRLRALFWADSRERVRAYLKRQRWPQPEAAPRSRRRGIVEDALQAYFAGDLSAIDELPVAPTGSPFQNAVWSALRGVPPGSVMSYAALASAIGRQAAVRAVGHANAANPISIVIPCHRLVGASGALTGYGGGITRKRWLLEHEAWASDVNGDRGPSASGCAGPAPPIAPRRARSRQDRRTATTSPRE